MCSSMHANWLTSACSAGRLFHHHVPRTDNSQHVSAERRIKALLPPFSLHSTCNMWWHVGCLGERSHDQCFLFTERPGFRGACPEGQGNGRSHHNVDAPGNFTRPAVADSGGPPHDHHSHLRVGGEIEGEEHSRRVAETKAREGQCTSFWRVTTKRGVGTTIDHLARSISQIDQDYPRHPGSPSRRTVSKTVCFWFRRFPRGSSAMRRSDRQTWRK